MLSLGSLQTHLEGEALTLARIWKITRADAAVYRFAEHDRDIVMPGDGRYLAAVGVTSSASSAAVGLGVDSMEAASVFDNAAITRDDLAAGLWDGARVDIWEVNWADPSMGRAWSGGGLLGQVRFDGSRYTVELLALTDLLATSIGRVFQPGCDAVFGDARCAKDLTALTHSFTVTSVTDRATFAASGLAQAAGYFNGGYITWATGENAGRTMEIKSHTTGGAMVLFLPMVDTIAVGDTGSAIAGCAKTFPACGSFNNTINFRGWPHLPGTDVLIAVKTS